MTNTNSNDYWAIAEDAPLGTTTQCHEAACHQYVGDITAHQAQVHKRTVRDRNLSLLNSKGRGIAGRVLPVLTAGALALGPVGCGSMNSTNGPVRVIGKESEAYIVQPLDANSQIYRLPFVLDTSAKVGDTINPNYVTEGKQNKMKGGQ